MKYSLCLYILYTFLSVLTIQAQEIYFPEKGASWKSKAAKEFKINSGLLDKAVEFAKKNEYSGEEDLRVAILNGFTREPFHDIAGPTKRRGGPAGIILKNGYIIAQWGDVNRIDMTFSVTKSYLSTVAGLAIDKGLISNGTDKVNSYVWDKTFWGEHNRKITWEYLLNQCSDWTGELFGMKDWADSPSREGKIDDWKNRKINKPGTFFEFNDVSVNILSYSLLHVWSKPLP